MSEDLNTSEQFSDETIRRFLLGDLDPAERSSFEEQFLVDDELEARMRLVEFDLTDDYAFSRLTSADRKLFEQVCSLTTDRKRKLNVSSALRKRFASASVSKLQMAERLRLLVDFRQPAWRYAFALLLLALLVGTVWLVAKEPQIVKRFIPKRVLPKPVAASSPQEANHPSSAPPAHTEQSPQRPAHEASSLIVVLTAKSTIAEAPTVKRPNDDNEVVRLQLMLASNQPGSYHAEVFTIADQRIQTVDSLTSHDGKSITFEIPARLLKPGQYKVWLSRSPNGLQQSVANYYFRAQ